MISNHLSALCHLSRGMVSRAKAWCILLTTAVLIMPTPGSAQPSGVLVGTDYLTTLQGSFFDFGGPIGPVDVIGRPIDPVALGPTDTIIQRLESVSLPTPGSSGTSVLVISDLSLQSANPVNLGGSFFDVFFDLTPGLTSGGQMSITRSTLDTDPSVLFGTFDSFFDVLFTATFMQVGGGASFSQSGSKHFTLEGPTPWSSAAPGGVLIVPGGAGDPSGNSHSGGPAGYVDFYPGPGAFWHDTGGGRHGVALTIPEPETYAMLLAGLGLLGFKLSRWNSRAFR